MEPVIYSRRARERAKGEREWRVEDDALVTRLGEGRERRVKWREIVSVRLYHEPAKHRAFRYVFELKPHNKPTIEIDNTSAADGGFEDRSAQYTLFVRAALARIAAAKPDVRLLLGETQKRYFFLLIGALLAFCALAFALIVIPTPLDQTSFSAPLKLVLILLMIPIFGRWVLGSLPRGVPLDQVPERALPPINPPQAP